MAIVEFSMLDVAEVPLNQPSEESSPKRKDSREEKSSVGKKPEQMHRVHTVRLQQGVSLRTAARHTGTDIRQLRLQEQESTDLRISDLRKWQKALDVPLSELLVEPDTELSGPVLERARLIRLMKTAAAILENANTPAIKRMGQMLCDQLVDIMPELEDVSPWHSFGQRRSLDEFGAVVDRRLNDDLLHSSRED